MEDIILSTGWDSDSMEPKLSSILQPLLMDSLNLFGESKPEMLLLPITTLLSALIELELKSSLMNLLVEILRSLITISVTSMEAPMLQLLMVVELQLSAELVMES
jgi:hypothetical protein